MISGDLLDLFPVVRLPPRGVEPAGIGQRRTRESGESRGEVAPLLEEGEGIVSPSSAGPVVEGRAVGGAEAGLGQVGRRVEEGGRKEEGKEKGKEEQTWLADQNQPLMFLGKKSGRSQPSKSQSRPDVQK